MTLTHWDDVEGFSIPDELSPLGGRWQRLADAAGSVRVGAQRVTLESGQMITPPHTHSAEEEIFHVLRGSATLWQDGKTCTVGEGDTIVHEPGGIAHTLVGGADGFEVLIFGTRLTPEAGTLPRTRRAWLAAATVEIDDTHPWTAEAALGVPEAESGERPPNELWGAADGGADARERAGGEARAATWPRGLAASRHSHFHCLRSGAARLTYLAYGTKDTNDVC